MEKRELRVQRQKAAIAEAMEKRDFHRARECLEELVEDHREHGETYFAVRSICNLARLANRLGNIEFQLELTESCVRLQPDDGWAWAQHANSLLRNHREEDALAAYEQAERYGESFEASIGRAEILKELNLLDDALRAFDEAIAKHPREIDARIGRAEVLKESNLFEEALQAYDDAIANRPLSGVARAGRAEVLKKLNRADEARGELRHLKVLHNEDLIRIYELRREKIQKEVSPSTFLTDQLPISETIEMTAYFRSLESMEEKDQESALIDLAILEYLLQDE